MRTPAPATAALAGVLLTALNMRIGISQVGPVIEQIRADTGMSSSVAGLLGTIPFACFGLFAFAGAPLARRLGTHVTIRLALAFVAGGALGRALVGPPGLVLALTLPIGVGVALLHVALPAVIKHRFPARAAWVTGGYVAAISGGATLVALLTMPLAELLGGWRAAFAVTAVLALLPIPFWATRHRALEPDLGGARGSGRPSGRPCCWRCPSAWPR